MQYVSMIKSLKEAEVCMASNLIDSVNYDILHLTSSVSYHKFICK